MAGSNAYREQERRPLISYAFDRDFWREMSDSAGNGHDNESQLSSHVCSESSDESFLGVGK